MAFSTKRTSFKVQGLDFGGGWSARKNSAGSLVIDNVANTRLTLAASGAMTLAAGGLTITAGGLTVTAGGTSFSGGTGTDLSLAAGMNLMIGGTTAAVDGEGVLMLFEASQSSTVAAAGTVEVYCISLAGTDFAGSTLGWTQPSGPAATMASDDLLSDNNLVGIPVCVNEVTYLLVAVTAYA